MADEFKQEQPTPIDPNNPPEPIAEIEDKTIRELRAADVPVEAMPEEAQAVAAAESDAGKEARTKIEDTLDKPIEALEDAVNQFDRATAPVSPAQSLAPTHSRNETVLFGRTIPLPLYTVVFITLAVITIIEVVIAEIVPEGALKTVPLLVLSLGKAVMVVLFYMHLREDSRIFALALILPLLIALVSALFLLSVPLGY
ncbi:MAG: cytochrome C oxidase subunit IV family protein [Anaerolinea sp.]|nr:cytochrome C oxidase subunit IV family protein [Anaerolinea sp.]